MTALADRAPSSHLGNRTGRVTYAVSRWGVPTETFVRREEQAAREAGADVRVLSMQRPVGDVPGVPVTWVRPTSVVRDALRTVVRAPGASWRVLAEVARGSRPGTVVPRLVAAVIGLAWAQRPEAGADLVHAHFGWVAATAVWASSRITARPYSVVLHAFDLHADPYVDRFSPVPLRDATRVFTVSARDRELVADRWGVRADVLRMGVSDDWLEVPPVPADAREPWTVLAVGSLVEKKGHATLVDAVARSRHPWRLDIVGDGPLRAALEARIAMRGLSGRVQLLGARSEAEVRERLQRATVAALACVVAPNGDRDGIPVALMEAMACGTPVVSTRVGAIPELVEGGGILVPPSDADALAAALDGLVDPVVRQRLGVAARARIERTFRASDGGRCIAALAADVGR
jgi:glycosyltransferase involved in cell wall biosynthesis